MNKYIADGKRKVLVIFLAVFYITMSPLTAYAADVKVLQTKVYDEEIYIYIKGISELASDSTIQIGNTVCKPDQISVSSFEHMDDFMRTIILIDNSKSVPEKNHADIQALVKGIVSNAKENEQIKIGTFSKEATYLCDYTNDHVILENIIDNITYKDQDTYLSDVLYNIISELNSENTFACTRIIIVSDGADDNYIGYTNDEVQRYIDENFYPVYTVGIPKKSNASQLETMFSFSRAAKSGYFLMDGNIAGEDIVNALCTDQIGVCVKITPDEALKDGSNRSILLKLNTAEGAFELKTSADMPFGKIDDIHSEPELESQPEPETMSTVQSEPESVNVLPTISPASVNQDTEIESFGFLWIIILLAGIVVILIAVLIILLITKRKKSDASSEPVPEPEPVIIDIPTRIGPRFASGTEPEKELWGKQSLLLKNLDIPSIFFKVPTMEIITIGRRSTQDIMIDDPEVSREHCKIIIRGGLMYLQNCSKSNGTYYENVLIHEDDEVPIVNGGKIKIGQYQYSVELVDN